MELFYDVAFYNFVIRSNQLFIYVSPIVVYCNCAPVELATSMFAWAIIKQCPLVWSVAGKVAKISSTLFANIPKQLSVFCGALFDMAMNTYKFNYF